MVLCRTVKTSNSDTHFSPRTAAESAEQRTIFQKVQPEASYRWGYYKRLWERKEKEVCVYGWVMVFHLSSHCCQNSSSVLCFSVGRSTWVMSICNTTSSLDSDREEARHHRCVPAQSNFTWAGDSRRDWLQPCDHSVSFHIILKCVGADPVLGYSVWYGIQRDSQKIKEKRKAEPKQQWCGMCFPVLFSEDLC